MHETSKIFLSELDGSHPIFDALVTMFPYVFVIDTTKYSRTILSTCLEICKNLFGETVLVADLSLLVHTHWVTWKHFPNEVFCFKTQEDMLLVKMSV